MTRPRDLVRGGPPLVNVLILLGVLAPLAYIGYRAMFSNLSGVDDEGYVLIGMREFVDGRSLYDEIYSQYGPALYVLVGAPLGLFDLLDTDGAKWVQLLIWLSTSLLVGLTILRVVRNLPVAAVGVGLAFFVLSVDIGEALHPGGAISLLLIGIAAAAAFLLPHRPRAAMVTMGAFAAAIALMKVNMGGLAMISVAFALSVTGERLSRRRTVRIAACAALALVPFALLSEDLSETWGLRYAAVVSIGALAVGLAATGLRPSGVDLEGRWTSLAAGIGGVAAIVLGAALITGSSPSDLAHGVVLDPLELNDLIDAPLDLDPLGPLWVLAWLAGAALFRWKLAGEQEWSTRETALVGAASMAAGLALWISLAEVPGFPGSPRSIWLGAPLAWLVAVRAPDDADSAHSSFVRTLIPALAVLQLLHAYPVPGSQVGWSEFLLVLVGGICIADGIERLSAAASTIGADPIRWRAVASAAVLAFGAWFALGPLRDFQRDSGGRYNASEGLELTGANHLRLRPPQAEQYREAAADLREHCTTFISLPGLNSFYVWTDTPPPTGQNTGAWPWLLGAERQQRIVDEIDGVEGVCVLRAEFIFGFWEALLGPAPDRPLLRYISERFEPARTYTGFQGQDLELMRRRD